MVLLLPLLVLSRTASAAVPADEVDGRSPRATAARF